MEWILAGVWSTDLYTFLELDGREQDRIVAAYRIEKQIEAVLAWERERRRRRAKRRAQS